MSTAIAVRCLWNVQYIRTVCLISLSFVSKADWVISKSNSVSCFLQYTDFPMWVEMLCYRDLLSFGSLLCLQEHGICVCLWDNFLHFVPTSSVSIQCNMYISMGFIMYYYLAGLVNIAFITPNSRRWIMCLILGGTMIQNLAHRHSVLTHVFVVFVCPSRQLP
jgi:hypothetical protein